MPEHERRSVHDTDDQALKSIAMKELVARSVSSIAVFAHRARRFTMTDQKIDRFVVETLSAVLMKDDVTEDEILRILKESETMLDRARNLYIWSCEAFSKPIEDIRIAPILTDGLDRAVLMARCAEIEADVSPRESHDIQYWRQVALSNLATLAYMTVTNMSAQQYDIYGFFHKVLSSIADGLSIFELVALVGLIEKEHLNFANAQIAGDTLVDAPSPTCVRQSRILIINEPESVPDGSSHTGLAG